jgi:HAE1 family hydrophobic/amphiphilic exporter-1
MFSIPLAAIGSIVALWATGRPLGISAMIGVLMLVGIVVTNAIVLLDLVEQYKARGMPTDEALIRGGRTRVRPIMMTAIATMFALMPLVLGFSEGSIIAAELGTVVVGGLFTSTLLTLIVVPVVYSLLDGLKRRIGGGRDEADEEASPNGVEHDLDTREVSPEPAAAH